MTFMGFQIEHKTGNLMDPGTGKVLEHGILTSPLQKGLRKNFVDLNETFDTKTR